MLFAREQIIGLSRSIPEDGTAQQAPPLHKHTHNFNLNQKICKTQKTLPAVPRQWLSYSESS